MTSKITNYINSEQSYSPLLPDYDPEVTRIFEMVTSKEHDSAPRQLSEIPIEELSSIPRSEIHDMLIFQVLRSFTCLRKTGASITEVLHEAITNNHSRIVGPLIGHVSPHDLGRAFTLACAHGRLDMVQLMLANGRISSAHLGEGYRIVCDFGYPTIAAELKHHSQISKADRDEGYFVAYREDHSVVMEIIGEKTSSEGIGKVFVQSCIDGNKEVAKRLVNHPRLKMTDLHKGLLHADELRSALDSTTRIQLFIHEHRRGILIGGLVTAAAAGLVIVGRISNISTPSLRMSDNLDPFFAQTQRCCSLK